MENPDELLSHYAVYKADIGDRVEVEVRLHYEHNGTDYCMMRTRQYEKLEGGSVEPVGEEVFRGTRIAANGETKTIRRSNWRNWKSFARKPSQVLLLSGRKHFAIGTAEGLSSFKRGSRPFWISVSWIGQSVI